MVLNEISQLQKYFPYSQSENAWSLHVQVSFSPHGPTENNLLVVSGSGVFKVMRAEDLGLKAVQHTISKRETTNFLAHAWISGRSQSLRTYLGDNDNNILSRPDAEFELSVITNGTVWTLGYGGSWCYASGYCMYFFSFATTRRSDIVSSGLNWKGSLHKGHKSMIQVFSNRLVTLKFE